MQARRKKSSSFRSQSADLAHLQGHINSKPMAEDQRRDTQQGLALIQGRPWSDQKSKGSVTVSTSMYPLVVQLWSVPSTQPVGEGVSQGLNVKPSRVAVKTATRLMSGGFRFARSPAICFITDFHMAMPWGVPHLQKYMSCRPAAGQTERNARNQNNPQLRCAGAVSRKGILPKKNMRSNSPGHIYHPSNQQCWGGNHTQGMPNFTNH